MDLELPVDLVSIDSPSNAHRAMLALLHNVVVTAASRRQEELPGLVETLQDDVVLTTGGTSRPADGVLVTLLHEACHVWAQLSGVRDTSRDGRYHNRRFAEIALAIGLAVEKDTTIGHHTPALSSWARADYADLLDELERGLVLAREPEPAEPVGGAPDAGDDADEDIDAAGSPGFAVSTTKYIFASCRCLDARRHLVTIRVAKGSWRPGVIYCSACQAPFTKSLTIRRQHDWR